MAIAVVAEKIFLQITAVAKTTAVAKAVVETSSCHCCCFLAVVVETAMAITTAVVVDAVQMMVADADVTSKTKKGKDLARGLFSLGGGFV